MKSEITIHQVAGKQFKVWSDFIARATFAQDENGVIKPIRTSGYISNDLTIRKEIAIRFGLSTFRR